MSKNSVQQRIACAQVATPLLRKGYEDNHKVSYKDGYQWVGNKSDKAILTGNQPILKNN
jgi:hypothetical protein